MAELYRFFDGTVDDPRAYSADEFAEYFRQFIRNGVFNGGDELQVSSENVGMKTYVRPGKAWINGYFYKNTEPLYLDHAVSHATLDRIDRVVLRLDHGLRTIGLKVLTGIPSATPQPPAITRDSNTFELSLAQVNVKAGAVSVSPANIVDERFNGELCGIVTHLFEQINTTGIFAQFEAAWNDWFGEVQDVTNLVTRTEFLQLQMQIVPPGAILMWSGAVDAIPTGWALCDGQNGTPDLRDRFIVGAGGSYDVGDTGGAESVTLTVDQMPQHSHSASSKSAGSHTHSISTSSAGSHTHTGTTSLERIGDQNVTGDIYAVVGVYTNAVNEVVSDVGVWSAVRSLNPTPIDTNHSHTFTTSSKGSHSHSITISSTGGGGAHENRPPYYALAYIMKL